MSDSTDRNPGFDRSSVHRKGASSDSASDVRRMAPPAVAAPAPGWRISVVLKLTLLVGLTLAMLMAVFLWAGEWYWKRALQAQVEAQLSAVTASRRESVQAQVASFASVSP